MSLVEQELHILPEHLSSPQVFGGVRVTRSLVLYVCIVDRCLSFCTFSFGHCVVCSSSIYEFWLPLWYLQTLLKLNGANMDSDLIFNNHIHVSEICLKKQDVARYVMLRIPPLVHLCQICIYLNTHYQKML